MDYGVVLEGATRLRVPSGGGVSSREEVFYNPHMSLNRDITVALCSVLGAGTFLDAMAGSGARGIRASVEAGADATLNDLNPKAVALIRENANLNGAMVCVESREARGLMSQGRWDYVDVDPFGTPAPYLGAAAGAVRPGGVLGVCATDTSALCGTYPKACQRKYGSQPLRCDCYGEVGLRILIGAVAEAAMRRGLGFTPLFSHTTRHYMRVQGRLGGGASATVGSIGYLEHCPKCMRRSFSRLTDLRRECACGHRLSVAGPLWTAPYADSALCSRIEAKLAGGVFGAPSSRLAGLVAAEQDVSLPFYDVHRLAEAAGRPAPGMAALADAASKAGYKLCRTHFCDTGVRTDMPVELLMAAVKAP
jgi:tRNA (guanine26-N2/guanine27-N2)-dimethyltransferase